MPTRKNIRTNISRPPAVVDMVNHPSHYTNSPARCSCGAKIECIQITEHMSFSAGNAVKYIWRSGEKGTEIEDLEKSIWYLVREIARLRG